MGDDIKLGRVAGFPLAMNWSVLVIGWLLTWSLATGSFPHEAPGHASGTYWLAGLGAAAAFFVSLLGHEVSHALVARRNGIAVKGLTLWLFGGVAELDGESPSPGADFRIAAAGPAASLGLGAGFALLASALQALGVAHLLVVAMAWLAGINLLLGVFNLIPGAPLDGGRVLRSFLWHRHGDRVRATVSAARAGSVVGYGLIGFGLVQFLAGASIGGLWLVFIGWFVLNAARAEEGQVLTRQALAGLRVADVMTPSPSVAPGWTTVADFHRALPAGQPPLGVPGRRLRRDHRRARHAGPAARGPRSVASHNPPGRHRHPGPGGDARGATRSPAGAADRQHRRSSARPR